MTTESRVDFRSDGDDVLVVIRPSGGRIISLLALIGLAYFFASGYEKSAPIWVPLLGVFLINAFWQFFGSERIRISSQELRIDRRIGSIILVRPQSIAISQIDTVEISEKDRRVKGRRYTARRINFLHKGNLVARSIHISKEDARTLLAGPFEVFADHAPHR